VIESECVRDLIILAETVCVCAYVMLEIDSVCVSVIERERASEGARVRVRGQKSLPYIVVLLCTGGLMNQL